MFNFIQYTCMTDVTEICSNVFNSCKSPLYIPLWWVVQVFPLWKKNCIFHPACSQFSWSLGYSLCLVDSLSPAECNAIALVIPVSLWAGWICSCPVPAYFSKRLSWCWMIHVSNHSSVFLGLALIILWLVMCGGNLRITPAVKEVKESVIVARWWRWDVNCPSSPVQSVQLVKVVVTRLIYGRSRSQVISFVCYTSRTIKKDL